MAETSAMFVAINLLVVLGPARTLTSVVFFAENYGVSGLFICIFGSPEIWRIQVQILGSSRDSDAMDFKRSAQDDSNIIAVASTILAQVAITALSLENLSRTHWTAKAFFTFSLVSSIMAVYYSTSQYRILGRCLRAEQVKAWIRSTGTLHHRNINLQHGNHPGMPSAAAVLNMSAPSILLSSSLNAFLIGLGVYLGFVWTRNLDKLAGVRGSRAVFVTYIVGLIVCYCVYALSRAVVADQSYISERQWLQKYVGVAPNPSAPLALAERFIVINRLLSRQPAIEINAARPSPDPDVERAPSPNAIPESLSGEAQRRSMLHDGSTRKELLELFQEAADMRKTSAQIDERLARLLQKFGEETVE